MPPYENSQAPNNQNSPFTGDVSPRDFGKLEEKVSQLCEKVSTLEGKVSTLEEQKNKVIGAGIAIGLVLPFVWDVVKKFFVSS